MVAEVETGQANHRVSVALPWEHPGGFHTRSESCGGSTRVEVVESADEAHRRGAAVPRGNRGAHGGHHAQTLARGPQTGRGEARKLRPALISPAATKGARYHSLARRRWFVPGARRCGCRWKQARRPWAPE